MCLGFKFLPSINIAVFIYVYIKHWSDKLQYIGLQFCTFTKDLLKLLTRFILNLLASYEILMSVLFLVFSEYLAIFKKTVAMHEVFLCRVAAHPILRKDLNFHVFLEYNQDVSIEIWIAGKRNHDVLLW